jgi:uncharacterized lipoprotein YmbA
MRSGQKMLRHTLMVGLLCLVTACGSSPKTDFYMLSADEGSVAQANISEGPAIGVWIVILPELLDRSEIVTRENQHKIKMADFSWWASALDKNMTLMVAVQLSQHLQSNRVVTSPWPTYVKNDYQVTILVSRFDGKLGGEVVLRGLWNILDGEGEKKLDEQVFEFKTNTAEATYQAMVEAMSQLTVQLAEQLVDGIISQESM